MTSILETLLDPSKIEQLINSLEGRADAQVIESWHAKLNELDELWGLETIDDEAVRQVTRTIRKFLIKTEGTQSTGVVHEAIAPFFEGMTETVKRLDKLGQDRQSILERFGVCEPTLHSQEAIDHYHKRDKPVDGNGAA